MEAVASWADAPGVRQRATAMKSPTPINKEARLEEIRSMVPLVGKDSVIPISAGMSGKGGDSLGLRRSRLLDRTGKCAN
ncbi:MAG: hypothetical protein ACLQLG_12365 [Thermoguttaceae bacterium]